MTVRQASQRIGISPSLIYALCHEGIIPHTRHGRPGKRGTIRIEESAVDDYCRKCKAVVKTGNSSLVLKHITV